MTDNLTGTDEERTALVRRITAALTAAAPTATVALRGSLAGGHPDPYSDIDLCWTVPDNDLASLVAGVAHILGSAAPIISVRSEPEFQNSAKRRLIFVLFDGVPLFWRLDLEVWAASIGVDPDYDADNPAARGDDWSLPASAMANAIATIKAVRRGRHADAAGLLARGFARIGASAPAPEGDWLANVVGLADAAARQEAGLEPLASRVRVLARGLLGDGPAREVGE